jgi:DNA-binding MarR family transcriptional regulator
VSDTNRESYPEAARHPTHHLNKQLVAGGLVLGRLDQVLRPWGLAVGSFNALMVVAGADAAITPSEVAARIPVPVTAATMTGLLDTLERRGLVARRPHPDDRRRVLVEATAAGRELLAAVVPAVQALEAAVVAGLPEAHRRRTTDALGTLVEHVRALPPT